MFRVCDDIASANGCLLEECRLYRGFAWLAVIRKPEAAAVAGKALENAAA